jgi:hypothetical protein
MTSDNCTRDGNGKVQEAEPSDHAFTIELLREYAGNCLLMAKAIELGKPYQKGLAVFDGTWLMMRVMVESLDAYDGGTPRRALIDLSAAIIGHLKQRRAEIIDFREADDGK